MSNQIIPIPRIEVTVRPATMSDLPTSEPAPWTLPLLGLYVAVTLSGLGAFDSDDLDDTSTVVVLPGHVPLLRADAEQLRQARLRVDGDYSSSKMGAKIREATMQKVPYMFVVGGRAFTSIILQKNCHEFIAYENLVGATISNSKLTHAAVGLNYHVSDRFILRADYGLHTVYLSDSVTTEYRASSIGVAFFF